MANREHLKILRKGVEAWNIWRRDDWLTPPDLQGAELFGVDLRYANLNQADLQMSWLDQADLTGATLDEADLFQAHLETADLTDASLIGTDLTGADLTAASLRKAKLVFANLTGAALTGTDFSHATVSETIFGENDLSTAIGLEEVNHVGPSTIGIDTLFKSLGRIPEVFLREAGVPDDFITFLPSLVGRVIEFYSSFISYSHHDHEFARRLHSRMREENLRVWYAPEDMKAGRKLHEEIFRAIQIHDKLLLVLSESSIQSEWVMTEIRRARKVEREENRRKLFPIRLVDFETIQTWECFDADSGKDLAVELREYYIPDFSNWKNHDLFEAEFAKLLRDLRATEK